MGFPLSFWDISLLLAVMAIILLATSEIISPYYGKTSLIIEKKRLRQAALILGLLFIVTIIIRMYGVIILP